MKSFLISTILATAITAPAAAQDFYLQGEIGVDLYPDNSIDGIGFDVGPGGTLGGRFGADIQIVRVELGVSVSGAVIDLENDPGETANLADSAGARDTLGAMRSRIGKLVTEAKGDPGPPRTLALSGKQRY